MRRLLALSILALSLIGFNAFADDPPVTPTTVPGVDAAGNCTEEFIITYIGTGREIQALSAYLQAGVDAPNLFEANMSCTRILAKFPTTSCKVPGNSATPKTADFATACATVAKLYAKSGLANRPPPADLESTPINRLDITKLNLTVQNKTTLDSLIVRPRMSFAINGSAYDLAQAIDAVDATRCAIDADKAPDALPAQGQAFKGQAILENFVSGIRVTRIAIDADFGFVCMNDDGRNVTFGDLKKAFGSMLTFTMAP